VADLPERPDDPAWSAVEQAFFESAPPEEPGPVAEPLRFDDLGPAEPARRELPAAVRAALAAASAARASIARSFQETARRARPAVASAREITVRAVRAGAARLLAARPARRPGGQGLALTLAGLILVMGLSAGVVASRNGPRTISTLAPAAAAPSPMPLAGAATPAPAPAPPVEHAAEPPPAPEPPAPAAADRRPPRAEAAKRPARGHRRLSAGAPSRRADIMVPTFMQAGAQPAAPGPQPAPARRPVFSR
jgi:pyruvate dehydrogenase E2 component (dihydrolipoyllysine-residue acetyltransferase)